MTNCGHAVSREDIPEQVAHHPRSDPAAISSPPGAGMTGANALIAETGTVDDVHERGQRARWPRPSRRSTSCMAGIEKLIPTLDDRRYATALARPQRHRSAHDGLHHLHDRTDARARDAHHPGRQRPPGDARDARIPGGAALHSLRRLRQCLPAVPRSRRSRLRPHLHRRDRSGRDASSTTGWTRSRNRKACASPATPAKRSARSGFRCRSQIIDTRKMVVAKKGLAGAKRVVFAISRARKRSTLATRIGSRAQKPLRSGRCMIRGRAIPNLNKQTRWRSLPALAVKPLHDRVAPGRRLRLRNRR